MRCKVCGSDVKDGRCPVCGTTAPTPTAEKPAEKSTPAPEPRRHKHGGKNK